MSTIHVVMHYLEVLDILLLLLIKLPAVSVNHPGYVCTTLDCSIRHDVVQSLMLCMTAVQPNTAFFYHTKASLPNPSNHLAM